MVALLEKSTPVISENDKLQICYSAANYFKTKAKSHDYNELVSEAYLGVQHALSKYSENLGTKFSSYATYWAKWYIRKALRDTRVIPVNPQHLQLSSKIDRLRQQGKKDSEITQSLNLSTNVFNSILSNTRCIASLNHKINNKGQEADVPSASQSPENAAIAAEELNVLKSRLHSRLSDKERLIINLRFYRDNTLKQISQIVDLSIEGVRLALNKAIKKLGDN